MNNQELEQKIKEIVAKENMFDMIIAAKEFDKDYRTSDFYRETKMGIMEVIKNAKMFYSFQAEYIKDSLQKAINGLDMSHLNELFDKVAETYGQENAETMQMLDELKDFKDIIHTDKKEA
jgi:uncharacterized protein YktA (UPF0223 family)